MNPMSTAPVDGTPFLAYQEQEFYVAKFDEAGRLMFRTHRLFVGEKHRIIDATLDGRPVKAYVRIDEPWDEGFEHVWTFWTAGFSFKPTHWSPLPEL